MGFSELHQFFNDLIGRIGEIGDKTGNSLFEVQKEISNLNHTLGITNILLAFFWY